MSYPEPPWWRTQGEELKRKVDDRRRYIMIVRRKIMKKIETGYWEVARFPRHLLSKWVGNLKLFITIKAIREKIH